MPGQVVRLLVDEGDVVMAGEPVARMDTTILEAERNRLLASKTVEQTILRRLRRGEREEVIDAARATVAKLAAEVEQSVRNRDRIKRLRDHNAVSESEYDSALFTAKSVQASLDAAKARLLELETGSREEDIEAQENRLIELDAQASVLDARIEKAVLTAPFTAHVIQRLVDEGTVVEEGQPVFLLSEADRYEARFSVPTTQLGEAEASRAIFVTGNEVPVQDVRTISSVSPDTRTIDVVFTLAPNSSVIEGETCTLPLSQDVNAKCVELPVSALVPSVRGLWSVYRLEQDNPSRHFHVVREEVTINHTDGDRVFVESSLPDGSLVVGEGVHRLAPGVLVRIKDGGP